MLSLHPQKVRCGAESNHETELASMLVERLFCIPDDHLSSITSPKHTSAIIPFPSLIALLNGRNKIYWISVERCFDSWNWASTLCEVHVLWSDSHRIVYLADICVQCPIAVGCRWVTIPLDSETSRQIHFWLFPSII